MHGYSLVVALMCHLSTNTCEEQPTFRLDNELRNRLDQEERRAICCAKHMRCCHEPTTPPSIELRAILVRCPNAQHEESIVLRSMKQQISSPREHDIKEFQGFDEDEPLTQSEVVNCHKKLLITMKIRNSGTTNCNSEFVVVDHVYDPISEKRARLLNPYVIKIKQEAVTQMYKLRFQHVVNSEAREVVYTKHDGNYTGCDTTSSRPTCGTVKYKGKPIPYSTGFCCSCDALKNAERQPSSSSASEPIISYSDPAFLLDGVECPKNLRGPHSNPIIENNYGSAVSSKSGSENTFTKTVANQEATASGVSSLKNRATENVEALLETTVRYKLNSLNELNVDSPISKVLKDVSKLNYSFAKNPAILNVLHDKSLKVENNVNSKHAANAHKISKRENREEEEGEEEIDKIRYISGKSSRGFEEKVDSLKEMLSNEMKSDSRNGDLIKGISLHYSMLLFKTSFTDIKSG